MADAPPVLLFSAECTDIFCSAVSVSPSVGVEVVTPGQAACVPVGKERGPPVKRFYPDDVALAGPNASDSAIGRPR